MQHQLVFTVIAKDKPGLVEQTAQVVADCGGNWVDSSMARLGGEFAGIVRIGIARDNAQLLTEKLQALGDEGIHISLRSGSGPDAAPKGTLAKLEVVSQDHPGILRDVTGVLSAHSVSIEHLETSVTAGSMQGGALFKATAELRLPEGLAPADLSDALQETAGDLMADISLTDD